MKPSPFFIAIIATIFVTLVSRPADAANGTWTGAGSDSKFVTPANWSGASAPATNETATFNGSGNNTKAAAVLIDGTGVLNGGNGAAFIALTAGQTTPVALLGASPMNSANNYMRLNAGDIFAVAAGAGALTIDGASQAVPLRLLVGASGVPGGSIHTITNNNPSGGNAITFGTNSFFSIGGSGVRNITIAGTGDVNIHGRVLSAAFNIIKTGAGVLTLSGNNGDNTNLGGATGITVWAGTMVLSAGQLNINNPAAFGKAALFNINANGVSIDNTSASAITLSTTTPFTVGGNFTFAGTRDLNLGAGAISLGSSQRTITVSGTTGALTLGGVISGAGGIRKDGPGTLILVGSSTAAYTGTTNVASGLLAVNGSIIKSAVIVENGGALGGNGSVGIVTMKSGGALQPGDPRSLALAQASGTISSGIAVLSLDQAMSPSQPVLQFEAGGKLQFALGKGLTNTDISIANCAGRQSVAFNNNVVDFNDFAAGTAVSGTYVLITTDGDATTFTGLTVDSASGKIKSGLTLDQSGGFSSYYAAGYGYYLKVAGRNIVFEMLAPAIPSITSSAEATGVQGWTFSYTLAASGFVTALSIVDPLPGGLTFDPDTGIISGTPASQGTFHVRVRATNQNGYDEKTLALTILGSMPAPVFTISSTVVGFPNVPFTYTITADNLPQSIAVTGSMPPGLVYSSTSATIAGTPTTLGSWPLAVTAINPSGTTSTTLTVAIKVLLPTPIMNTAPTALGVVGKAFQYQITAKNTPETYAAITLPAGLTLNTSTGLISGTPTAAGVYNVTVSATNTGGTDSTAITITIQATASGPYITSAASALGSVGSSFNYAITVDGAASSYKATGMPRGLVIDTVTGAITGKPEVGGIFEVKLSATGPGGTYETTLYLVVDSAATLVTYAGSSGFPGSANGALNVARFNQPEGAVEDTAGNIYVADTANNSMRLITLAGAVTSYVGGLSSPVAVAIDAKTNLYVADAGSNSIKKIDAAKTITTLASGLNMPGGVAVDESGNVYFSDSGNNIIKKYNAADSTVSTIAGSGAAGSIDATGTAAQFNLPMALVYDGSAKKLYVADTVNSTIRVIDIATSSVTTVAGKAGAYGDIDGVGAGVRFHTPQGISLDSNGLLYVADTGNCTIRVCDPQTGAVWTLIGEPESQGKEDGTAGTARTNLPAGILADSKGEGDVFILDSGNSSVRALVMPPAFARVLADRTVSAGSPLTLDAQAMAAPKPVYYWYKDGAQISCYTASFVMNAVTAEDAGTYTVVAFNASGTVSSTMKLSVEGSNRTNGGTGEPEGGGGAPSAWFLIALGFFGLARIARTRAKQ